MNAVRKERVAPRTSASLRDELHATETRLEQLRASRKAASDSLPELIANADSEAIAESRRQIREHDAEIARLIESVEATRHALEISQGRDRKAARAQLARRVGRSMDAAGEAMSALADAIVTFGEALPAARKALDEVEAVVRNDAGVYVDPLLLRAKITSITEMALWLHTEGAFGRAVTLDNRDQLRANRRADLKAHFAEYESYVMTKVRAALGIEEH